MTARTAQRPPPGHRSIGFLLLYAIANAGGVLSYLPLLTLLLPMKIEAAAGDARLGVFTATVIAGAMAASLSNIVFGWLSDRSVARGGGRRRWVLGGLIASALTYVCIAAASTPGEIVASVIVFQIAINCMLCPLSAIMADEIPDGQKGLTGGMLALSNPVASGVVALLVSASTLGEASRLAIVVLAFAAFVTPLLLTQPRAAPVTEAPRPPVTTLRRDLATTWAARLCFQMAGVVLSLYVLYYFESLAPEQATAGLPAKVGHLLTLGCIIPLPIAVLVGRLSDRLDRRKPFLFAAALLAAAGLLGMALARDWTSGAIAFAVYAAGSGIFLPLQSAFSMQLLPDPLHRGRDLGLLNLTNTLPSLLGPGLTWLLATPRDFSTLMLVLAALALGGGFAILGVRGRR